MNFLLYLMGISCFVAAFWVLPRHQRTHDLEMEVRELQARIDEARGGARHYERLREALLHDPSFRESVLRRVVGQQPPGVMNIEEWVHLRRKGKVGSVPQDLR